MRFVWGSAKWLVLIAVIFITPSIAHHFRQNDPYEGVHPKLQKSWTYKTFKKRGTREQMQAWYDEAKAKAVARGLAPARPVTEVAAPITQ